MHHLAVVNARQPEDEPIINPPDATNRQAAALDNELQALPQGPNGNPLRTIRIELNGVMLDIKVDIRSVCAALNLPQHDIFHNGIYNEYQHDAVEDEEDQEDVDHREENENNS